MTTPQPLDEEELAGLVALLDADHHHDHEGAHGAGEAHDHHSRFALTVTGVRRRAAHLMRVEATIDDPDFDRWCLPNVAIRLELPVQPPELTGLESAPRTASRVYTIAETDPARRGVSVDFVVHPGSSPAMQWLASAGPGDVVEVWPPSQHRLPAVGGHHVLLADSTGLPAAVSILRLMKLPGRVRLLARVPQDEIPSLPGVEVVRVERDLGEAFAGADLDGVDSVWAAAEAGELRPVRRHCRQVLGLDKEHTQVCGYWRRGTSNTQIDIDRLRGLRYTLASGGNAADFQARLEEEL